MNSPCASPSWRKFLPGKRPRWLIVTAFLLTTSSAHFAQTNDNAATAVGRVAGQARTPALPGNATTVRGRVTDESGAVLTGASVTLGNLATGMERVVITDANGNFAFGASNGARYRLVVSAVGFAPISREVESSGSFNFMLEPATLAEKITVVSGSRQEELRESLDSKVDVIGRNRIRDTGYESVAEVLQELPGVVTRRGTQGAGAAGEQVQGIDSRQVLSLFDGQPIIGGKGIKRGVINLDRQSINTLERIEVVKGAASALYGSDAIGGVINQISRDPSAPVETSFTTSGGSQGRFDARGDVGFARDKFSAFFSGERHKQNDFDLTPTTIDTTGAGFHRYDGLAKIKYRFTPNFALSAWARGYWNSERGRARGEEGNLESFTDEDAQSFNLAGDWQINDRTAMQSRGYFTRFDEITNSFLSPSGAPVQPGNLFERLGKVDASFSRIQGERQFIQGGAEWMTNTYGGINRLQNDKGKDIDFESVWAQDRVSFANRATVTLGLRFDNHSIFGSAVSPKAGLNLRVTDYWRIRASYGRGFRAPDLGQLFYRFLNPTNFYQVIGNPNLRPEYAHSVQAGGEFTSRGRRARFGVNLFRNDVEDLIDSVSLGFIASPQQLQQVAAREGIDLTAFRPALGRLLFLYKNISDAVTQGVEFDGDVLLPGGFSLGGAYTYLNARDTENRLSLLNRHKHQGNVRLAWESDARVGLRANLRGTFYSKWINTHASFNPTTGALTAPVISPGFSLWDFYAAKRVYRGLEFFAAVDNFTDSRDPNVGGPLPIFRPEVGRAFRVGMRFTWAQERR
jgi:outer membrane receptor for ferrienterochelin and colicins